MSEETETPLPARTIVSPGELQAHSNLDSELNSLLEQKIAAAEGWIETYIGEPLTSMDPLPAAIREAVLQLAAHFYENREATLVGVSADEMPFGVMTLIRPYRIWSF